MNLQVGVKVLLRNENHEVLVLKRSEKYGAIEGSWDIPGGRIEPGSTLGENLAREVQEETGLQISSALQLVGVQDIFPSNDQHVVRVTYTGRAQGDPILDEEHTEYRWVAFNELLNLAGLDQLVAELIHEGFVTESSWL